MIGGLAVDGDAAEDAAGIEGGGEQGVEEELGIDMVRAAEGGKGAADFQKLEGAEMDLFVAAQGIGHGGAVAGEGGGVEDDKVEPGDDAFVGLDGGVVLEPVEDVDGVEGGVGGEAVAGGVALGGGDGIGALVEEMDVRGAGAGGVEAEAAEEAEAVEDLAASGEAGDGFVIGLLVEVHAGFVAADEVGLELEAVEVHGDGAVEGAEEEAAGFGEAFEFAGAHVAAFEDDAGGENLLERGNDEGFALVHAEGGDLDDEDVFVLVDDEAAEGVALGVDDAEGGGGGHVLAAHGEGGADAALEEGFVEVDAVDGEEADVDLGPGVEDAGAKEALAVVFDLDEFAVGDGLGETEDFAVIDPGVTGKDAVGFTGFEQHCGQCFHSNRQAAIFAGGGRGGKLIMRASGGGWGTRFQVKGLRFKGRGGRLCGGNWNDGSPAVADRRHRGGDAAGRK